VHDPNNPNATNRASTRALVRKLRATYIDIEVSIDDEIGAGNRAAMRWTCLGVDTGPLHEPAPAEWSVIVGGITISRPRAGRIVEEWLQCDPLE
jgi:hypothetical protein